jgi:glycyl-tRNA synthetase alpha chain
MVFENLINTLNTFWKKQGCLIAQPYDIEVGAGTFHPLTFFKVLGGDPWRVAFVQPSRRPTDGRYGDNPLRTQAYFQYQVIVKPSLHNIQDIYLDSLRTIGVDPKRHDIRFVEDDWESPTLGAGGLGWEVWLDSLEITQFTYFQQMAGFELDPISCEITYGLERIAMCLQKQKNIFDLTWSASRKGSDHGYGDLFKEREIQFSNYHFEEVDPKLQQKFFEMYEGEAKKLIGKSLYFPAYDYVLKMSHAFNLLDAIGAVSTSERPNYIARIRALAKASARKYVAQQAGAKEKKAEAKG